MHSAKHVNAGKGGGNRSGVRLTSPPTPFSSKKQSKKTKGRRGDGGSSGAVVSTGTSVSRGGDGDSSSGATTPVPSSSPCSSVPTPQSASRCHQGGADSGEDNHNVKLNLEAEDAASSPCCSPIDGHADAKGSEPCTHGTTGCSSCLHSRAGETKFDAGGEEEPFKAHRTQSSQGSAEQRQQQQHQEKRGEEEGRERMSHDAQLTSGTGRGSSELKVEKCSNSCCGSSNRHDSAREGEGEGERSGKHNAERVADVKAASQDEAIASAAAIPSALVSSSASSLPETKGTMSPHQSIRREPSGTTDTPGTSGIATPSVVSGRGKADRASSLPCRSLPMWRSPSKSLTALSMRSWRRSEPRSPSRTVALSVRSVAMKEDEDKENESVVPSPLKVGIHCVSGRGGGSSSTRARLITSVERARNSSRRGGNSEGGRRRTMPAEVGNTSLEDSQAAVRRRSQRPQSMSSVYNSPRSGKSGASGVLSSPMPRRHKSGRGLESREGEGEVYGTTTKSASRAAARRSPIRSIMEKFRATLDKQEKMFMQLDLWKLQHKYQARKRQACLQQQHLGPLMMPPDCSLSCSSAPPERKQRRRHEEDGSRHPQQDDSEATVYTPRQLNSEMMQGMLLGSSQGSALSLSTIAGAPQEDDSAAVAGASTSASRHLPNCTFTSHSSIFFSGGGGGDGNNNNSGDAISAPAQVSSSNGRGYGLFDSEGDSVLEQLPMSRMETERVFQLRRQQKQHQKQRQQTSFLSSGREDGNGEVNMSHNSNSTLRVDGSANSSSRGVAAVLAVARERTQLHGETSNVANSNGDNTSNSNNQSNSIIVLKPSVHHPPQHLRSSQWHPSGGGTDGKVAATAAAMTTPRSAHTHSTCTESPASGFSISPTDNTQVFSVGLDSLKVSYPIAPSDELKARPHGRDVLLYKHGVTEVLDAPHDEVLYTDQAGRRPSINNQRSHSLSNKLPNALQDGDHKVGEVDSAGGGSAFFTGSIGCSPERDGIMVVVTTPNAAEAISPSSPIQFSSTAHYQHSNDHHNNHSNSQCDDGSSSTGNHHTGNGGVAHHNATHLTIFPPGTLPTSGQGGGAFSLLDSLTHKRTLGRTGSFNNSSLRSSFSQQLQQQSQYSSYIYKGLLPCTLRSYSSVVSPENSVSLSPLSRPASMWGESPLISCFPSATRHVYGGSVLTSPHTQAAAPAAAAAGADDGVSTTTNNASFMPSLVSTMATGSAASPLMASPSSGGGGWPIGPTTMPTLTSTPSAAAAASAAATGISPHQGSNASGTRRTPSSSPFQFHLQQQQQQKGSQSGDRKLHLDLSSPPSTMANMSVFAALSPISCGDTSPQRFAFSSPSPNGNLPQSSDNLSGAGACGPSSPPAKIPTEQQGQQGEAQAQQQAQQQQQQQHWHGSSNSVSLSPTDSVITTSLQRTAPTTAATSPSLRIHSYSHPTRSSHRHSRQGSQQSTRTSMAGRRGGGGWAEEDAVLSNSVTQRATSYSSHPGSGQHLQSAMYRRKTSGGGNNMTTLNATTTTLTSVSVTSGQDDSLLNRVDGEEDDVSVVVGARAGEAAANNLEPLADSRSFESWASSDWSFESDDDALQVYYQQHSQHRVGSPASPQLLATNRRDSAGTGADVVSGRIALQPTTQDMQPQQREQQELPSHSWAVPPVRTMRRPPMVPKHQQLLIEARLEAQSCSNSDVLNGSRFPNLFSSGSNSDEEGGAHYSLSGGNRNSVAATGVLRSLHSRRFTRRRRGRGSSGGSGGGVNMQRQQLVGATATTVASNGGTAVDSDGYVGEAAGMHETEGAQLQQQHYNDGYEADYQVTPMKRTTRRGGVASGASGGDGDDDGDDNNVQGSRPYGHLQESSAGGNAKDLTSSADELAPAGARPNLQGGMDVDGKAEADDDDENDDDWDMRTRFATLAFFQAQNQEALLHKDQQQHLPHQHRHVREGQRGSSARRRRGGSAVDAATAAASCLESKEEKSEEQQQQQLGKKDDDYHSGDRNTDVTTADAESKKESPLDDKIDVEEEKELRHKDEGDGSATASTLLSDDDVSGVKHSASQGGLRATTCRQSRRESKSDRGDEVAAEDGGNDGEGEFDSTPDYLSLASDGEGIRDASSHNSGSLKQEKLMEKELESTSDQPQQQQPLSSPLHSHVVLPPLSFASFLSSASSLLPPPTSTADEEPQARGGEGRRSKRKAGKGKRATDEAMRTDGEVITMNTAASLDNSAAAVAGEGRNVNSTLCCVSTASPSTKHHTRGTRSDGALEKKKSHSFFAKCGEAPAAEEDGGSSGEDSSSHEHNPNSTIALDEEEKKNTRQEQAEEKAQHGNTEAAEEEVADLIRNDGTDEVKIGAATTTPMTTTARGGGRTPRYRFTRTPRGTTQPNALGKRNILVHAKTPGMAHRLSVGGSGDSGGRINLMARAGRVPPVLTSTLPLEFHGKSSAAAVRKGMLNNVLNSKKKKKQQKVKNSGSSKMIPSFPEQTHESSEGTSTPLASNAPSPSAAAAAAARRTTRASAQDRSSTAAAAFFSALRASQGSTSLSQPANYRRASTTIIECRPTTTTEGMGGVRVGGGSGGGLSTVTFAPEVLARISEANHNRYSAAAAAGHKPSTIAFRRSLSSNDASPSSRACISRGESSNSNHPTPQGSNSSNAMSGLQYFGIRTISSSLMNYQHSVWDRRERTRAMEETFLFGGGAGGGGGGGGNSVSSLIGGAAAATTASGDGRSRSTVQTRPQRLPQQQHPLSAGGRVGTAAVAAAEALLDYSTEGTSTDMLNSPLRTPAQRGMGLFMTHTSSGTAGGAGEDGGGGNAHPSVGGGITSQGHRPTTTASPGIHSATPSRRRCQMTRQQQQQQQPLRAALSPFPQKHVSNRLGTPQPISSSPAPVPATATAAAASAQSGRSGSPAAIATARRRGGTNTGGASATKSNASLGESRSTTTVADTGAALLPSSVSPGSIAPTTTTTAAATTVATQQQAVMMITTTREETSGLLSTTAENTPITSTAPLSGLVSPTRLPQQHVVMAKDGASGNTSTRRRRCASFGRDMPANTSNTGGTGTSLAHDFNNAHGLSPAPTAASGASTRHSDHVASSDLAFRRCMPLSEDIMKMGTPRRVGGDSGKGSPARVVTRARERYTAGEKGVATSATPTPMPRKGAVAPTATSLSVSPQRGRRASPKKQQRAGGR